jgi:CarD family transcriptional regulator
MNLKIGSHMVYPSHGLVKITEEKNLTIQNQPKAFLVFNVIGTGMTVMVPKDKVRDVGLRELISKKSAGKVLAIIKSPQPAAPKLPWAQRYRAGMEKLRTGSAFEIAEVYKSVAVLARQGNVSFGEKQMLALAGKLLTDELALVLGEDATSVEARLSAAAA